MALQAAVGCTSEERGGNVGVLICLETMEEIYKLSDTMFSPYIVRVNTQMFTSSLVVELKFTGHVPGMVLLSVSGGRWDGKIPPSEYSDDSPAPLWLKTSQKRPKCNNFMISSRISLKYDLKFSLKSV